MTEKEYMQKINPCWGCEMPAVDRAYACSLETEGCVKDGN